MHDLEVQRLAAFTDDPAGGNPAGVAVLDDDLDAATMLAIAADVGYSETAFLWRGDEPARYTVRYFSPAVEVPFCGHATIASAVALGEADDALDHLVLDTPSGVVPVEIDRAGGVVRATLTSPPSSSAAVADDVLDEALACFGWDRGVLAPDLPPAVASAGATHLVLPLADRADLRAMTYDVPRLEALLRAEDLVTVHVVWREAVDRYHARDPFPIGGVVEDPATGAAAAAFGGYLRSRGELPTDGAFTIIQGEDMGRRSVLQVEAPSDLAGVRVTGGAVRL